VGSQEQEHIQGGEGGGGQGSFCESDLGGGSVVGGDSFSLAGDMMSRLDLHQAAPEQLQVPRGDRDGDDLLLAPPEVQQNPPQESARVSPTPTPASQPHPLDDCASVASIESLSQAVKSQDLMLEQGGGAGLGGGGASASDILGGGGQVKGAVRKTAAAAAGVAGPRGKGNKAVSRKMESSQDKDKDKDKDDGLAPGLKQAAAVVVPEVPKKPVLTDKELAQQEKERKKK
jgi:hypothetical protein